MAMSTTRDLREDPDMYLRTRTWDVDGLSVLGAMRWLPKECRRQKLLYKQRLVNHCAHGCDGHDGMLPDGLVASSRCGSKAERGYNKIPD
jgi:hypothetical protein